MHGESIGVCPASCNTQRHADLDRYLGDLHSNIVGKPDLVGDRESRMPLTREDQTARLRSCKASFKPFSRSRRTSKSCAMSAQSLTCSSLLWKCPESSTIAGRLWSERTCWPSKAEGSISYVLVGVIVLTSCQTPTSRTSGRHIRAQRPDHWLTRGDRQLS
jgi:hypothetical protein